MTLITAARRDGFEVFGQRVEGSRDGGSAKAQV
jgi:hypothetical protein